MGERKHEESEGREQELGDHEAADAGRAEPEGAEPQQGEGRMSGSRTGRFGGANEDPAEQTPGFTPEGRSGT